MKRPSVFGSAKSLLFLWCVVFASALNAGEIEADGIDRLAKSLFTREALCKIQLSGTYRSYSAYDSAQLQLMSSDSFVGVIDLASRSTHFDLFNYVSPVEGSSSGRDHSLYSVTYDGEKWVVSDHVKGQGLPGNLSSLTSVSATRPSLFLKSLDQLCFPLFPSLIDVEVGGISKSLLQILGDPKLRQMLKCEVKNGEVAIVLAQGNRTDKFVFDDTDPHAFRSHDTVFAANEATGHPSNVIENRTLITESQQVSSISLPKKATFSQVLNGKEVIKREYTFDQLKILPNTYKIEAVVPANTYITDDRLGIHYRTGDRAPTLPEKP